MSGEPDIGILDGDDKTPCVTINGVDAFVPNTGEIRSNDTKDIAAWLTHIDDNEEGFFVRHAYFLGANDAYKSPKAALKARSTGRIAVKVINHFGDEVMKVFRV